MTALWPLVVCLAQIAGSLAKSFITYPRYQCPEGWELNAATRRCYKLVNRPMPQLFAQQYCKVLDPRARLVRIQDKQENDFVREYTYGSDAIWIGAKAKFDIIDSKAALFSPGLVLRWKNGNAVKYTNWETKSGLDKMDSQHMCVVMNSRGKWTNANCNNKVNFVCERKIEEPASESAEDSGNSECPRKWVYRPQNKACYRAYSGSRNTTWLDGDKLCGDAGEDAALVSVTSILENKFVMDLARRRLPNWQYIFLGAIGDTKSRKHWDWVDGNMFKQFSNWDTSMPKGNRRQAVLAMARNGRWLNTYADQAMPGRTVVVCKFSILN